MIIKKIAITTNGDEERTLYILGLSPSDLETLSSADGESIPLQSLDLDSDILVMQSDNSDAMDAMIQKGIGDALVDQ